MDSWLSRTATITLVALMQCTFAPDPAPHMEAIASPALHRDDDLAETDAGPRSGSIFSATDAPAVARHELPQPSAALEGKGSARSTQRRSAPRGVRAEIETGSQRNRAEDAHDDALREVAEDATDDPLSGLEDLR